MTDCICRTRAAFFTVVIAACADAQPLFTQTDVFVSGKDGYNTYRIPAIETTPDGTLVAFTEARKYNASDPGSAKQEIDLVYKRSTDIRQETGSSRWLAESTDGGTTWNEPRPSVGVAPVACALERLTLEAGGDDRNRLLWTGPKGPQRTRLEVRTSYDEGKSFTNERQLSDSFAAYSDLTVLKDRTVGILWERGETRGYQFITFTRFNREWLEQGKK